MKKTRIYLPVYVILCVGIRAAQIDTIAVYSSAMQQTLPALVVVPELDHSAETRFPVVYLLHGYSGDYLNWTTKTDLGAAADRYEVIIVCPDGGYASWYLDSPVNPGSQYSSFIGEELISWIDAQYMTIARKDGRAITGLSMGGHGALYIALTYPQNYTAVGSMSGVVDLTGTTKKYELSLVLGEMDTQLERWQQNSILYLTERMAAARLSILIDCGVDDPFIDMNRKLHRKLMKHNVKHEYLERPGGHSWDYWVNALDYHLLFFSKQLVWSERGQ